MPRYALLLRASANRVFGESAFGLAAAEVELLDRRVLGGGLGPANRVELGGVDYLVVEVARELEPTAVAHLSNLSSLHAAFGIDDDGRLRPLPVMPRRVLDEDLLTIQRYGGKTNEAFTHLLVNLALAASDGAFARVLAGERVRLLDPACGRGTTLNRAAMYGMDAGGIDIDGRDVEAYDLFLTTWLKDKRLKHKAERATLRKGRPTPAHRVTITYGRGKDTGEHRVIDVVHDDTIRARDHFRARSFDSLAGDLPYGVQHGAQPGDGGIDRSPDALLEAALPVWFELLKPGAGVALGWNRHTLARPRLKGLVEGAGFAIDSASEDAFLHRVDRAITRDVLVATRPPG